MTYHGKLLAYQKAFELAMRIFEVTKLFPDHEKYGLVAQIRCSSRSVCANLAEAFKRKRYKPYFLSKLNDAESENSETEVWLEFSIASKYLEDDTYQELLNKNNEVGKLIWYMMNHPEKFM